MITLPLISGHIISLVDLFQCINSLNGNFYLSAGEMIIFQPLNLKYTILNQLKTVSKSSYLQFSFKHTRNDFYFPIKKQ
jgi:hypothetical protein